MAEAIGMGSGSATLGSFALERSFSLHQVIKKIPSNKKNIRNLKNELEALNDILETFLDAADDTKDDFSTLDLPLFRCGTACSEFEALINKFVPLHDGSSSVLFDWTKLRYMGDDIDGFKDTLAGYKSTIAIALADANLRTVKPTAKVFSEYQELIVNTEADLKEILEKVEQRLKAAVSRQSRPTSSDQKTERERLEQEIHSLKQCLTFCTQVPELPEHLKSLHLTFEDLTTAPFTRQVDITKVGNVPAGAQSSNAAIQEFRKNNSFASELQLHLDDLEEGLKLLDAESAQLAAKKEVTEQLIKLCRKAHKKAEQMKANNLIDVAANEEALQIIVSTIGALINAHKVTAGIRSGQILGQMSDASLQRVSTDRRISSTHIRRQELNPGIDIRFSDRYGTGRTLS